jgi:BppU N-terminal domain
LIKIKQGDTRYGVHAILKDNGGTPIDLTGASVSFFMSNGVTGLAIIVNPAAGEVMYPLEGSATKDIGTYKAEFKVHYQDARIETFPNDSYIPISIIPKVGV